MAVLFLVFPYPVVSPTSAVHAIAPQPGTMPASPHTWEGGNAMVGRVENWRARWRERVSSRTLSMARWVHSSPMATFPVPASSHAACRFPALRAPAHFTSRVMGLSDWRRFPRWPIRDVVVFAQFIAVCSASTLAEELPSSLRFSSQSCEKRRAPWRYTPLLRDQRQASTKSDKLSDPGLLTCTTTCGNR